LATRIATKSVEYPGTYTITPNDILLSELSNGKKIQYNQLQTIKNLYANKKIVFTNGCFDLLHSGHISLFKFCKEKGDIVIVGLNSDDSIRRLKGTSRPINKIKTRTDVLESIQYIDYIIEFDDDTPYATIKELNPYYLIKGGDYKVDDIIGREFAQETIVCDLVNGYSSTSIINKITQSVSNDK
jgi:D-beta-D-heptose 7-phosphate kinase/D-beta-D-heptose 1-phosphate adenosyltransferase